MNKAVFLCPKGGETMEILLKTALILFIIKKVGIQLILGFANAVLDVLIASRRK